MSAELLLKTSCNLLQQVVSNSIDIHGCQYYLSQQTCCDLYKVMTMINSTHQFWIHPFHFPPFLPHIIGYAFSVTLDWHRCNHNNYF